MGYANPFITLPFPDLSEDPEGDLIWVKIRNPKLVTQDTFVTPEGMQIGPDGKPVAAAGGLSVETARANGMENISRVIVDWHVYDATDLSDTPALLELPATAEKVAKLPSQIIGEIGKHLKDVLNPS